MPLHHALLTQETMIQANAPRRTVTPCFSARLPVAVSQQRALFCAPRSKSVITRRPGSLSFVRASAADDAGDKAKSAWNKTKDAASDAADTTSSRKVQHGAATRGVEQASAGAPPPALQLRRPDLVEIPPAHVPIDSPAVPPACCGAHCSALLVDASRSRLDC